MSEPRIPLELSEAAMATFLALADFLIPASPPMPVFSAVGRREAVEQNLLFRPDIREAFFRGLAKASGKPPEPALEELSTGDGEAFSAIGLIAVATYYMTPSIRALIGYPGQESVTYDADAIPPYLLNGMLEPVMARGKRYRSTPR
jgi:hypothetical protein